MSPNVLNLLVYKYCESNVCPKLAARFGKAAGVDAAEILPEGHADIAEIVRLFAATEKKGSKRKMDKKEEEEQESNSKRPKIVDAKHFLESDKCFNCDEPGHFSRDCPTQKQSLCFLCKKAGHLSRECPSKPPPNCYNCNKSGHLSRDCPLEQTRPCYNCNQVGHIARDCTSSSSSGSTYPQQQQRWNGGGRGGGGGFRRGGGGFRPSNRTFGTGANTIELGQRKKKENSA